MRLFLTLIAIFWGLSSCFERKEGCLDSLASNYDVNAYDSCEDCCVFPDVRLNMTHKAGDSVYNSQDTLINNFGELFNIVEVRYYLSDVDIFQDNVPVRAFTNLSTAGAGYIRPDDIAIVRSNTSQISLGKFRTFGQFDKISFRLGVDKRVLTDTFVNLSPQHPLNARNKIQDSEGELFQMSVRYRVINPDTLRTIWIDSLPGELLFTKQENVVTRKGEQIIFRLESDYLPLFMNTELSRSDDEVKNDMIRELNRIFP